MMSSLNDNIIPVEILLGLVLNLLARRMSNGVRPVLPGPSPREKLEFLLSRWEVFRPLEGRCSARKSGEPVEPRIARLQERFGFAEGEPLTRRNVRRLISNSDYASTAVEEDPRGADRCAVADYDCVKLNGKVSGQQNCNSMDLSLCNGEVSGQQGDHVAKRKSRNIKINEDFLPIKKRRTSYLDYVAPAETPSKKINEEAWSFEADCNFKLQKFSRSTL